MFSSNIFVFAMSSGFFCAASSSLIDDFFISLATEKSEIDVRNTINKCLVLGCTAGLLLGVIFYAFTYTEPEPMRMIVIYAILFGIVSPLLSRICLILYSKLFHQG